MNISKRVKNTLILILAATTIISTIVHASNPPGSAQNPIISLEYLEERLASLDSTITEEQLTAIIQTVTANVMFHMQNNQGNIPAMPGTTPDNESFIPIFLESGTILTGDYGTELIIRGGTVLAYVYGYDGIVNITSGTEHFSDEVLRHNELLLIPRRGPRGIRVMTDAWVMIRGGYFIR